MRNENIVLGEVVPPQIRLECYKQAREIVLSEEPRFGMSGFGLCLLLPCILWDLVDYEDSDPSDNPWDYEDTEHSFPEIIEFNLIEKIENDVENKMAIRLEFLEWAIQKLESC